MMADSMDADGSGIPDQVDYWNHWHRKERIDEDVQHERFRRSFLERVADSGPSRVIELGCGQGQDAILINAAGHHVDALDFSEAAIHIATRRSGTIGTASFQVADISQPLPHQDAHFGAAYAYLSLHYFDDMTTRRVFDEIARVLRPGGILGFVVRSVNDRFHGKGVQLGEDFYSLDGHVRHFFSKDYAYRLLDGWADITIVEYQGNYVGGRAPDTFVAVIAKRPLS